MEESDIESAESITNDQTILTSSKKIEHIVMSGGGIVGLSFYGILRESNKRGKWDINNIKTIYGTSVGSILRYFYLCDMTGKCSMIILSNDLGKTFSLLIYKTYYPFFTHEAFLT